MGKILEKEISVLSAYQAYRPITDYPIPDYTQIPDREEMRFIHQKDQTKTWMSIATQASDYGLKVGIRSFLGLQFRPNAL